jgi:pyridoxal phosphate enzyme (YggS family)
MTLAASLAAVRARIASAALTAGRDPATITLLAISKTVEAARLAEALAAGQRAFGENYVQEALPKMASLAAAGGNADAEWHFTGPIQSNKTAAIAAHFAWAHGVDRLKIAERLSAQRPANLPPLQVCVQVNVSGEASKAGCAPREAVDLCRQVAALPHLKLRGLMCLPAPAATLEDARAPFARLRELCDEARAAGLALDTLSMGMSDDLEAAIAEGATLVRVGSAIFGARVSGEAAGDTAS